MSLARAILVGHERRSTSQAITLSDLARLYDGDGRSESGVSVTRQHALTVSAWFRGLDLISSRCASCRPRVLRKDGSGYVEDRAHPVQRILTTYTEMTQFTFLQTRIVHKLDEGNGYAWVARTNDTKADELIPLDPARVTPFRENGKLRYLYEFADAERGSRKIDPGDILHFKGMGWDGLVGYSRRRLAKEALGLEIAARGHGSRFFANGARMGVLLEFPGEMKQEVQDRFLANWRAAKEGLDNSWKTVILEDGMKASAPLTMPAKDAQLLELRGFGVRDVANFLGCPSSKLNDVTVRTFASVEQDDLAFRNDTIDPHLNEMEQELEAVLLTEKERLTGSHVIRFDRSALVQADLKSRGEADSKALGGLPWKTRDEVRATYGLGPTPGGDQVIIPINQKKQADPGSDADAGDDGTEPPEPKPTGDDAARAAVHAQVVSDAKRRLRVRLAKDALRAAKTPAKFGDWLGGMRKAHDAVARRTLATAAACLALEDDRGVTFHLDVLLGEVFEQVRGPSDRAYSTGNGADFVTRLEAALGAVEEE